MLRLFGRACGACQSLSPVAWSIESGLRWRVLFPERARGGVRILAAAGGAGLQPVDVAQQRVRSIALIQVPAPSVHAMGAGSASGRAVVRRVVAAGPEPTPGPAPAGGATRFGQPGHWKAGARGNVRKPDEQASAEQLVQKVIADGN